MSEQIKFFTPQQASTTLPLVRKIVEDILAAGAQIHEFSQEVGTGAESDPRIVRLMEQIETLMEELENLGCYYKDWNFTMGLVDFPSKIKGEDVFLCWRSDEPALQYYHGAEEGFPGRKLIPKELL